MAEKRTATSDIIDIDLSVTRKKKFRIDQDDNRILELNTSDMSLINRLEDIYPKLMNLSRKAAAQLPNEDDEEISQEDKVHTYSEVLKETDAEMRSLMDELFDANVSEVCAPYGSMYDPINGEFRFEHIINTLTSLYEENMKAEISKISKRIKKHTGKYTNV